MKLKTAGLDQCFGEGDERVVVLHSPKQPQPGNRCGESVQTKEALLATERALHETARRSQVAFR